MVEAIKKYEYFHYLVTGALLLREKEEATIDIIIRNIQREDHSNIDNFSQQIIISQTDTLSEIS